MNAAYREQRSGGGRNEIICGGSLRRLTVRTGEISGISWVAITNFQLHRHQFYLFTLPTKVQLFAHKVQFTQLSYTSSPQVIGFKTIFAISICNQAKRAILLKWQFTDDREERNQNIKTQSTTHDREHNNDSSLKLHRRWRRRRFGDALLKEFLANRNKKA